MPQKAKIFLSKLVKSKNENTRIFVSETLRPVRENRWIHQQPEYSLSILKFLFKEKNTYPRTSVGNNLSDLVNKNPDLIYNQVEKLIALNNKNSQWIANRACLNLIKKEPIKVMKLLKTDLYKY